MSDQTSIFGNTNTATQPNANPAGSNPAGAQANANDNVATLLSSIKNERGEQKYADIASALEGLRNAQEFIPTLRQELTQKEQEMASLREKAERAAELERTLAELTNQRQQAPSTPAPAFDESKLAEIVNRTLTQREQQALAQANLSKVVGTLQTVFGTDAETKFYGKAAELGMTVEEINALAAKSPTAVLTMLGVNQQSAVKPNTPNVTTSTANSAAFTPNVQTFVGRNPKPTIIGATSSDIQEASVRAKKMVEELHTKGMSVYDLTDPKVYAKYFS